VLGILPVQHVARVLDHRMLETTTRTQIGNLSFARETNRRQRAVHAAIGTGRYAPEAVEIFQHGAAVDLIGGNPDRLDPHTARFGRHLQRKRNRTMRGDVLVTITHQSNT
jgi:hypothetical protein